MKQPGLFDKELCYLTLEARAAHQQLIAAGYDSDLALCMLEAVLGEELYELPEDDDELTD
jgi:hypothetical protein